MKLIALRDFSRVPALDGINIENARHQNEIHKGATFEIGKAAKLEDLNGPDKLLVAQLVYAGAVGDATDKSLVDAVKSDLAADKKREEAMAAREAAAGNQNLMNQLTALLSKASK